MRQPSPSVQASPADLPLPTRTRAGTYMCVTTRAKPEPSGDTRTLTRQPLSRPRDQGYAAPTMGWGFVWLMFILKIPIAMLLGIVWWAIKQTDEPVAPDSTGEGGTKQPRHPRPP